ncbi:hypothetical protein NUW58_g8121 [Xylaria curta]|uniref:Uncharacterized protein n=1 Tax=Xylaria curta TaxID=42375 RepID=A0ACC1NCF1_9PEZI|nr:hypothetical protein NUW58_g8121 [Xylaria curta]
MKAKQFDRPRPANFWRIFSPSSHQGRPTNTSTPCSMAGSSQSSQAVMLSGPAKLSTVTSLVETLAEDLTSNTLLPHQRDGALEELKIYGRDPRDADPIFTKEGIEMLTRHAFDSPSSTTSRNALRCLCNALLLKDKCRQIFVDLGYEAKVCDKLKNDSFDDEFLVSRIVFLTTYGTNAKLDQLIDKHHIADSIVKNLERHARHHNDGRPTTDPMQNMALTETAKLLFNITHHCKQKTASFTQAVPHVVTILCKGSFPVEKPLDPPIGSLVNTLLNLDLGAKEIQSSLYPRAKPTAFLDHLIDLLEHSRTSYNDDELESTVAALIGAIRVVHEHAPEDAQILIQQKLLPTEADRKEVLGRSGSLPSWLLRNSTNPVAPKLRETISELLFDLSDKDASRFVENVGYGFASGFLYNRNITIPQNAAEAFSNDAGGSSRPVNPITGQFLDSERHPNVPEMTEAEREREAEKLFVLFQSCGPTILTLANKPVTAARRATQDSTKAKPKLLPDLSHKSLRCTDVGMASSSGNRIEDAGGHTRQENLDGEVRSHPRHAANAQAIDNGGEGESVNADETRGTNAINEDDDPFADEGLRPTLKRHPGKFPDNFGSGEQDADDDEQDNEQDDAPDGEEGDGALDESTRDTGRRAGSKRTRFVKDTGVSAKKGKGSSVAVKQEIANSTHGVNTRKRGRPSKKLGHQSKPVRSLPATRRSPAKRKEGVTKDGLRRSSRAASESATQQIAEQSKKRPRTVSTPAPPSTRRQKKVPIASSGGRSKRKPAETPTKPEYEVELILGTRKKAGKTEYLVKWKGYHVKDNTWEPAANLTHCSGALKQFRSG